MSLTDYCNDDDKLTCAFSISLSIFAILIVLLNFFAAIKIYLQSYRLTYELIAMIFAFFNVFIN